MGDKTYDLIATCPYCSHEVKMDYDSFHNSLAHFDLGMRKICNGCGELITRKEFKDNCQSVYTEKEKEVII